MIPKLYIEYRQRFGSSLEHIFRGFFTEYETPKLVLINSITFAILLRILQIIILTYSILYLLLYEKGYQKQDSTVISSVTLKVKGIGYIDDAQRNRTLVVDGADYIIPPSENNAIFIMTNFIRTDQTRTTCAESEILDEAVCTNDTECQNRPFSPQINGRWTGRCLLSLESSIFNETTNTTKKPRGLCEYTGWCPPQNDLATPMLVQDVLNFTIFIKNSIEFPTFNVKHQNIAENLRQCIYHQKYNKNCPIFSIDDIMNNAEENGTEQKLMLRYGGVIRVKIDYDCNLDRDVKLCKPTYSFARLDVPFHEKPFSAGFNFRYASYWKHKQDSFRTFTKAFGLRLIISVSGKAGKFDFITLTLNTGSLVGIFGLATFLCDVILFYLSKNSRIYRDHVFENVHLGTRHGSISAVSHNCIMHDIDENSKTKSNEQITTQNGILQDATTTSGKTVVIRPLTLMNPERLINSQKI